MFEKFSVYCDSCSKQIPLTFILGFYVSFVINRWWTWFKAIPNSDEVAHHTAAYISYTPLPVTTRHHL